MNPLQEVEALGQSLWLDYMRRDLITTGKLQEMMDEDGISGITSNPTIF
jgi:transaldolase